MTYKIPDSVINKKLYSNIKNRMNREHKNAGKRWSAYSSGQLVKEYKRRGGSYKKNTKPTVLQPGISRWFKEEWINACYLPKIVKCGRNTFDKSGKKFPMCRPRYRISSKTPKTAGELTKKEINMRCKLKKKDPKKIVQSPFRKTQ